jgi:hypothetical protein
MNSRSRNQPTLNLGDFITNGTPKSSGKGRRQSQNSLHNAIIASPNDDKSKFTKKEDNQDTNSNLHQNADNSSIKSSQYKKKVNYTMEPNLPRQNKFY